MKKIQNRSKTDMVPSFRVRPAIDLTLDPLPGGAVVERVVRRGHATGDGQARFDVTLSAFGELHACQLREQPEAQVAGDPQA